MSFVQVMRKYDFRKKSPVQGEIQWGNCHAPTTIAIIKNQNSIPIHIWKSVGILNSLGAGGVNIGFQSKFPGPGWKSMGEFPYSNLIRILQDQGLHINSHMEICENRKSSWRRWCQHLISEQILEPRMIFNGRISMLNIH